MLKLSWVMRIGLPVLNALEPAFLKIRACVVAIYCICERRDQNANFRCGLMFWRANKKRYGIIPLINCKPHDVCAGRHIGWGDQFEIILPIKFVNIIFVKMNCRIVFWFVPLAKF